MLTSCSSDDNTLAEDITLLTPDAPAEVRPLVHHEVTVSLNSDATTRVVATPGPVNDGSTPTNGLQLSWSEYEQLGVYIQNTSTNAIERAGFISSIGHDGDRGSRTFTGAVKEKTSGEKYIYMHPDLGSQTSIDYTTQNGVLGSTAHLSKYIPLVWREGNPKPENQGYIVHVKMHFKDDPGTIRSIKMCTMKRGNEDRIFPKAFDTSRISADVNNSVASNTQGTELSTDNNYTDNIILSVEGSATEVGTGADRHWEADAYIVCSSVENLNVFSTKYQVKADCDGGLFTCSNFISFPGQDKEPASTSRTLAMLSDGKVYNLNAKLTKDVCNTIISSSYGISSILGMWNNNGEPYDPMGLIVNNPENLPSQLHNNRNAIITRYKEAPKQASLKLNYSDLYKTNNPNNGTDWKQEDVTFNNISIVEPTEVFFTYLHNDGDQGAGVAYGTYRNKNLVGYYYYDTPQDGGNAPSSPNAVQKNIVFPNTTVIEEFKTVQLLYTDKNGYVSKTFPAGVTVGFYLMINPTATDAEHSADFSLMKWTQWTAYSNSVWNKSNLGWPSSGYTRSNFFATGDVSSSTNKDHIIPGLAFYAVKDRGDENINASWCHSALIYMISTSNPDAMKTYNKGFINIGTGTLINNK